MKPCWVLVIAKGLGVWLPPEVYLQRELALMEAHRWRTAIRIPEPGPYSRSRLSLHEIRTQFPEPWRACPVRVGVTWNVRTYPKMRIELMAADEEEGQAWLRRRVPRSVSLRGVEQVQFERRGVTAAAGVVRAKRVLGF